MTWWQQLDKMAGSRPRCVSFIHGKPAVVAERLTQLVELPSVLIPPQARWIPRGQPVLKPDGFWDVSPAREVQLDQYNDLITREDSEALRSWWLAYPSNKANTPNWDIACTCEVSGKKGLVLVEAKAHAGELTGEEHGKKFDAQASDKSFANHQKIGQAIADAAANFQRSTLLPCSISRDRCYQMSNRLAMASKLTEMGYAVVLVYLGFLNATEMAKGREILTSSEQWTNLVVQHSFAIGSQHLWNREWDLNNQSFTPLIRSLEWSFEA
jgi:hypothetical protein